MTGAPATAAFVRSSFAPLQEEFFQEAAAAEAQAAKALATGDEREAVSILRALVERTTERAIERARQLAIELPRRDEFRPLPELAEYWDARDSQVMADLHLSGS